MASEASGRPRKKGGPLGRPSVLAFALGLLSFLIKASSDLTKKLCTACQDGQEQG